MNSKAPFKDEMVNAFLAMLKSREFFGWIEAHYEKGQIVLLRKHEALLEDDVRKLIEN